MSPVQPLSTWGGRLAVVGCGALVLAALFAGEPSAADAGAPVRLIVGRVLPNQLDCAIDLLESAVDAEWDAMDSLQFIVDRNGDDDANDLASLEAIEALDASIDDLIDARDAILAFDAQFEGTEFKTNHFGVLADQIDMVIRRDESVIKRVERGPNPREARVNILQLRDLIFVKEATIPGLLGVRRPRRIHVLTRGNDDSPFAVCRTSDGALMHTFDSQRPESAGLRSHEVTFAVATTPKRDQAAELGFGGKRARVRKDRFLAFRGKRKADGRAFYRLPHAATGPFDVQFEAGVFRKPGRKHSPDAFLTVEFDVEGSVPLEFFAVSTRFVPADPQNATPAVVQVFANSTGGAARGDLSFANAAWADVRVTYDGSTFDVSARPGGATEDAFQHVGSWTRGGEGVRWVVGVGGERLRKGTELGIDNLVLTPR